MRNLFIFILLISPLFSVGQSRYFVYLKDKDHSLYSIESPQDFLSQRALDRRMAQGISITETDLPVSEAYLSEISNTGFSIIGKSKWLNAVLVDGPSSKFDDLKNLEFVNEIELDGDIRGSEDMGVAMRKRSKFDQLQSGYEYGYSLDQIKMLGADSMHIAGFTGEGILIGVMDAGFPGVNAANAFSHLRDNNRIVRTWDVVGNSQNVYKEHSHGSNVLSIITAQLDGKLYGTAPDAEVALYITEDNTSESRQEEVFWTFAAEDADSLGVDVINTSLGYSEFDDPSQDYLYTAMDGKSTIISRAAEYAASVGIVVVIAAGNEGNNSWRYITAPADGEKVIAVGAVNKDKILAGFSSRGPSPDGRIKPDVSAMGSGTGYSNFGSTLYSGSGTSYAAPLIAGFVANLIQEFPSLKANQIKDVLIKSADRYTSPDNDYGYGIPHYTIAKEIIHSEYLPLSNECDECLTAIATPNPIFSNGELTIKIGDQVLPGDSLITLINNSGQILLNKVPYSELNMSNFDAGVYIVNFSHKHQNYSKKIVLLK